MYTAKKKKWKIKFKIPLLYSHCGFNQEYKLSMKKNELSVIKKIQKCKFINRSILKFSFASLKCTALQVEGPRVYVGYKNTKHFQMHTY